MAESGTMRVLVFEAEEAMPARQALPRVPNLVAKVMDVPIVGVRESIQKVTEQIEELVQGLPADEGSVRLKEISIGVSVSASGSVQFIAGGGGEIGSTMTLTFNVAGIGDDRTTF
jgi:hypothetical protein